MINFFKRKKIIPQTDAAPVKEDTPLAALQALGKEEALEAMGHGAFNVQDIIAPPSVEIDFDQIKIGNLYYRTLFVSGYPRFVSANWLSPLINFDSSVEISMFYYPVQAKGVLDDLRRKVAEMEVTISSDLERRRVVDPAVKAALEDAKALQEQLVKGEERFFQFSFYVSISAPSLDELNNISKRLESTMGSLMLISKHATLQMEDGFKTTLPTCTDKLFIIRNMDTTSIASTFPFTSSELTANEGVLYGINEHNNSLVIFDRFTLENANSVVFAKAGAGKSYAVKLEIARMLMFGTEVVVIDPEQEYKRLCESVEGEFIEFSQNSPAKINPFDLSGVYEEGENELGTKILSLHTMFKIVFGKISPSAEAVLDKALISTYRLKGITQDSETQKNESPLLEDLYKVLLGMIEPEAREMAVQLEPYLKGSMAGIFSERSTVDLKNAFVVFSVRSLEDKLRPLAMYVVLDFIWTRIKRQLKKRVLVVDEAWYLMQYPDTAMFLYSIAKRARKYYLGLTTITQDVEDFLNNEYGWAIVKNSSLQVLFKQHPAAMDKLGDVFYLSEGEKRFLLSAGVGEGLFFAGSNHVAIKVVASPKEHLLITTKPEEVVRIEEQEKQEKQAKQVGGMTQEIMSTANENHGLPEVKEAETSEASPSA